MLFVACLFSTLPSQADTLQNFYSGTITVVNASTTETYRNLCVQAIYQDGSAGNAYWDGDRDNFTPGSTGTATGILLGVWDQTTGQWDNPTLYPIKYLRARAVTYNGDTFVYSTDTLPYSGPGMTGNLTIGGTPVQPYAPAPAHDERDLGANSNDDCGMPRWEVSEPYISLWLYDEPLGYQPAVGPRVSLELAYNQRENSVGFSPNICGVGARWNCSWISYLSQNQSGYTVHLSGGGQINFNSTQIDYQTHTSLTGDTNTGFTLLYPDGSQDFFGFVTTNGAGKFGMAFMTQRINPQGQRLTFNYNRNYDPTNPAFRLLSVVDADGRTNQVFYNAQNSNAPNLISQVTDPFGRSAFFTYDAVGNLTITDTASNSSSVVYDSNQRVTGLTTPYGTTSFTLQNGTNNSYADGRSILVTRPDQSQELYLFNDNPPGFSATAPNTSPFYNAFGTYDLSHSCSFHWGPRQYAALSTTNTSQFTLADFLKARMRFWLLHYDPFFGNSFGPVGVEHEPSPDAGGTVAGQATWFDYAAGEINPSLISRVLPDGSSSYSYAERNLLGKVVRNVSTYAAGSRTNYFTYDSNSIDLLAVTNALGVLVSTNSYNAFHQVLTHSDALGELTSYTYNNTQQVTSVTLPSGLVITNLYASDNSLSQQIAVGAFTNSFTYTSDLIRTYTDARGLVTSNTWDKLNRLTSTRFPDGSYASNIYTRLDLTATRDRLGHWTYFAFDKLQRNTAITNALGRVTLYNYCPCGALDSILDAATNLTSFYYDNQGKLTNTIYADGYSLQRAYNLLRQVVTTTDSAGSSLTNSYNNQGLLASVKNAAGTLGVYRYDALDRLTNSTDANGVSVVTAYDNLDRPLRRSYPDGGIEQFGYTLNVAGYTSRTNPVGNVTLCSYDPLGRKTNEVALGVATNQFAYDGAGDLLTLTDGRNQVTAWNYDAYGRITNKVDAAGVVAFAYQYDAAGELTNRWTPAKGNTAYSYDPLGNRTSISYGGQGSISFSYDALSRLTNMVDGLGTTYFTYDAAGQLLSEGGLWSGDTVTRTYNNRLRASLLLSGTTNNYFYDSAGRLARLSSPAGDFGYAYDAVRLMQVAGISLPNSAYITNTYDSVARLAGTYLKSSANNVLDGYTYTYDRAGQRTNILRDYGLMNSTVSAAYDAIGELTSWTGKEANGTPRLHEQLGYAYDPAGNLRYRTNNAFVQTFTVGPANALTNITRTGVLTVSGATPAPASSVTVNGKPALPYADFTFASSNGFSLVDGQNTFTSIASNYYATASVTNSVTANLPASINPQFDANGNLTNDGTRSFSYDAENHLTNVTVTAQWKSDFAYDGFGRRRIARDYVWQSGGWVPTNEMHYVYDGNLVLQERDSNNVVQVTYTRGPDLSGSLQGAGGVGGVLARTDANGSTFYHADGNGNVTALIDANGYVPARYLYGPYGKLIARWGALADVNHLMFASKEIHPGSGLYFYGYRFYDPDTQRWLNRDPIEELGGFNLYCFVQNNPATRVDFLGLVDPVTAAAVGVALTTGTGSSGGAGVTITVVASTAAAAGGLGTGGTLALAALPLSGAAVVLLSGAAVVLYNIADSTPSPVTYPNASGGNPVPSSVTMPTGYVLGPGEYRDQDGNVRNAAGEIVRDKLGRSVNKKASCPKLRPERKYLGSKKHGLDWTEGAALAKDEGVPQGQWGSEADLDFAGEKAATLAPNEGGYFDLPPGSSSIVHMPDGTQVPATRIWVRNNGTGTFHGYPLP